ncbi:VOC family protein [Lysinibacillus sp. FSL K6-4013]|uniref:VOC family protein n=1 Tax=Lysinibacillus sp. FSL K6-4013 TaxID=2921504 RepID=UPI003159C2AE
MSLVKGFMHSGITVKDLDLSLKFYIDILKLKLRSRQLANHEYTKKIVDVPRLTAIDIAFLELPDGNILELLEYQGIERYSASARPCDFGAGHICLQVSDLDQLYNELSTHGVLFRSKEVVEITHGVNKGAKAMYIYDPDGYIIELMEK